LFSDDFSILDLINSWAKDRMPQQSPARQFLDAVIRRVVTYVAAQAAELAPRY
jgi:hypothetical protein